MRRITARETVRDILALLGRLVFRLAQATGVTMGALLVVGLARPGIRCTKEGAYLASMKSDLRNLMTAQEVYFADHGTFAGSLEAFGENQYMTSTGVSIVIEEATAGGWRAIATHSRTSKPCGMFVGDVAPPPEMKDAVEAEPRCWKD